MANGLLITIVQLILIAESLTPKLITKWIRLVG